MRASIPSYSPGRWINAARHNSMRTKRLLLIVVVAIGLAPGTFVRSPAPVRDISADMRGEPVAVNAPELGPFTVEAIWNLTSTNDRFGGYSALTMLGDGRLLAGSDTGFLLTLAQPQPGEAFVVKASALRQFVIGAAQDKRDADLEALTRDPVTDTIWGAYERHNALEKYDENLIRIARMRPTAMRDWSANSGPEAMTRLPDGRFVLIAEANQAWGFGMFGEDRHHAGLLYSADPFAGGTATRFIFRSPKNYRPVDITMLDEHRAIIVLRRFELAYPPRFHAALMIADTRTIRAGDVWEGDLTVPFGPSLPGDNIEGVTVSQSDDGARIIWLISDDNFYRTQRTLLYKLRLETGA